MILHVPLFFALVCKTLFASSFYEQPFPDTVRNSPSIVRGKVGKSTTEWATFPDGSKHLFTYYEVDVKEGLKGTPRSGSPIRMRELGGTKDGVSLQVSGTAHFETGEDVVVMLGESNAQVDNAYPVQGMMMGKYSLEKGPDGKELLRGSGLGASVSLDQLREIIRTQASSPVAPKPGPSAQASSSGLLTGKTGSGVGAPEQIHDENLASVEATKKSRFRPVMLIFGALIGIAWFLKSRRKKR